MADETTRKLLIKLGISTTEWKAAVNDIKAQLNSVNEQAKKDAAQMKATQKEQLDLTKQQIAEQQRLTAEARTLQAVDSAKAQWQKQQQEAIKTAVQQRILETAEAKKQQVIGLAQVKLEQEKLRLAQQQYTLSERQRLSQERQARGSAGEGGAFGAIGKFASTLAGGGLIGQIAGGALLGTGFAELLTSGAERIRDIAKAIVEATGPAQQLRAEFQRLAQAAGQDPSQMLDKLRSSTRGLVSDIDLFKVANNFMKSGLKLTSDQMVTLVSNTVNLARATGHTAVEATNALQRYFLTGRAMSLAMVTGINRQELAIKCLSSTMDPLTRRTLEFNKVSAEEEKMLKRVGVPATTLPELFQQVSNAERNFIDAIGIGVISGGKFGNSIEELSQKLIAFGPRLEEIATKIGGELAQGVTFIVDHLHEIKVGAEAVMGIAFASKLLEWTSATKKLAEGLGLLKTAEAGVAISGGAKTAIKGVATVAGTEGAAVAGTEGAAAMALPAAGTLAVVVGGVLAAMGVYWVINYLRQHPEKTSSVGEKVRDFDYSGNIKAAGEGIVNAGRWIAGAVRGTVQGIQTVAADTAGGFLFGKQESRFPKNMQLVPNLALPTGMMGPLTSQQSLATAHTPGYVPPKSTSTDTEENIALRNKLADQKLKLQQAADRAAVESLRLSIEKKQALEKQEYESGLISLQQYVNDQKAIENQLYSAERTQIIRDRDAQIKNIRTKSTVDIEGTGPVQTQSPAEKANAEALVVANANNKLDALELQHNTKIAGYDNQTLQDKLSAARETASELLKISKEGIQDQLQLLEGSFKQGVVDANTYLSQRRGLIEEEKRAVLDGLNLQFNAAENNQKEKERLNNQGLEAERQYQKQLSQLLIQESAVRLQASQNRYQLQTKPLQTQLEVAKGDTTGGSLQQQDQILSQLRLAAVKQIYELSAQAANPALDHQSKEWMELQEHIAATVMELQKYNQELNKMHNVPSALGGIFGSISGLAGTLPGRTAGAVSEVAGTMQQSSADIGKFTSAAQAQTGQGSSSGGVELFKKLGSTFEDLFKSGGSAAEKLQAFGDNLESVISGIMGVVKGVNQVGKKNASGASGALSGGMAGMQAGAAFGPYGMIAGAAGGAILGGISGSKEKQLNQDIHKITTQLQGIISDMQAGTISLSQAIQDLRQERQQAIQILSQDPKSGKGGGKNGKKGYTPSQLQAVVQQIDTQIQALVNQQTQTLEQLSTSLMEVANPAPYQEYLQTLQQIIQQYQQFASAAQGNAQEMTAANQYLNDSLNQYVVTLSQNLNQAQQTAINDALTLINLEYQRQQMINQEAQSQYDVLTQGVLTRQRTTEMTKGQEIGQIQYQAQMQMEQINEQISLQQYKVQTETQIFNLATTRIGLENQLLQAQEEQANYQIQQVVALSQVVADLTSGLSGGQLMQSITSLMSSGAMPTESGIMYAILELLGLSGNVPPTATQGQYGTQNWLAGIPATDASAAQYVAAQDPNFPNLIMSDQWAAAAQDAQQYQSQGEVEGYDMNDLISWLQSQGSGGGYAEGGTVDQTGPALVHKGEFVLSNPMVAALNAMAGGTPSPASPDTSTAQIPIHQTLLDITQQRTSMEMTVITARQSQIQAEMALLQAMNDTYTSISSGGSPTMGIEDMLQKVWQNRGRAGSAGFTRQTI